MACFGFVTLRRPPDFSLPCLNSRISCPTILRARGPYFFWLVLVLRRLEVLRALPARRLELVEARRRTRLALACRSSSLRFLALRVLLVVEVDFTSFGFARLRDFARRLCVLRPATARLGLRIRDLLMAAGFSVVNLLVGDLRERSLVRGLRLLLLRVLALRLRVPDERCRVCGICVQSRRHLARALRQRCTRCLTA